MSRFDAADETERRKLFADAIDAHRKLNSGFCTFEIHEGSDVTETEDEFPPWIQFAEKEFNLDATDAELDRLKDLLSQYPEFRIDQLESPEEAEGTNVRITARADPNRLGDFVERAFREVYELEDDYRVWAVEI